MDGRAKNNQRHLDSFSQDRRGRETLGKKRLANQLA
jgi:hypothetical protein